MPTKAKFDSYPTFPDNVPVAQLTYLSLGKLLAHDVAESEQLFEACRDTGFFLLDLEDSGQGEIMLHDADKAFDLNNQIYEIDQQELAKYAFKPPGDLFGYKGIGDTAIEDGSPDQIAFYSLSQDDILGNSSARDHPGLIESNRNQFRDFCHHAHGICCNVFSHLDKHLSLKPGTLASKCPQDKLSGTSLRFLKCLASPSGSYQTKLLGHTDIGAITILFNVVGGLQVLPPGCENRNENWRYIRPRPGCALVNLGDAMVQWSGGILKSSMHRVATPPGQQAGCTRLSVAYLVRPAGTVSMKRLRGGGTALKAQDEDEDDEICATDWERIRAAQIIKGENKPDFHETKVMPKTTEVSA